MDLFDLFVKISADSSDAEGKIAALGDKLKNGLGVAAKVGAAAIGAATTAATAFAAASVNVGKTFDSSMSQVAATMGYTVQELSDSSSEAYKTVDKLREFAQEMGSTTAFSASQAADALNFMALAGYDAETSMSMLPNVLNLAAAGGIALAEASDMVTDASSALGLSLDETSRLVDQMAAASSKSNTSVAQLGQAILTVGGTAKSLAGGTTELSTALGVLADNGIKGAEGGTALRNIILSLSAPTNEAAKMMKSLGVSAYDANGNMRPLEEIFSDFNGVLSTMTQGEQTNVLNTIFNKVDLKSANALLATSTDRWQELSGAIDNSANAAENMANVQLDNLEGDITLFKSALEGAQIVISDGLVPSLREFVQFGSEGISRITQAFKEGGLSGAMSELGNVISEGVSAIVDGLPVMIDAGMQLIGALGTGILQNLPTIVSAGLQVIVSIANGIIAALPELIPAVVDVILEIVEVMLDNLDMIIDAAIQIIIALAEGLIKALPKLIEKAPVIIEKLSNAIIENGPKLLVAAFQLVFMLAKGIVDNLPQIVQSGIELVQVLLNTALERGAKMLEVGSKIIGMFVEGVTSMASSAANSAGRIADIVSDTISDLIDSAVDWGRDLIDNFISGIMEMWENLKKTVRKVANTVSDFIGFSEPKLGPLSNFHTYAPDMMKLFAQGIRDNENVVRDQIIKSFDFSNLLSNFEIEGDMDGDVAQTRDRVSVVQNIYSKAQTAADLMREAMYEQERAVSMGV